ncbi:hypothetical protein CPB85DRAFT_155429 [Mucidula mucida]|nr:hypothetical protein CPB85DRAFT_155429 [Mucidula mucida]
MFFYRKFPLKYLDSGCLNVWSFARILSRWQGVIGGRASSGARFGCVCYQRSLLTDASMRPGPPQCNSDDPGKAPPRPRLIQNLVSNNCLVGLKKRRPCAIERQRFRTVDLPSISCYGIRRSPQVGLRFTYHTPTVLQKISRCKQAGGIIRSLSKG